MAAAREGLADMDEIVPGHGRLEAVRVVDVLAVILDARVHVARDRGELVRLGIAQIFERDGIEILELGRFEVPVERRKMIKERADLGRVRAVDVIEAAARRSERDGLRSEGSEFEQVVIDRDSGLLLEVLRDLLPVFRIEGAAGDEQRFDLGRFRAGDPGRCDAGARGDHGRALQELASRQIL